MNHPRSYRPALALVAALLAVAPAAAAGSPKQPWELTPEEHAATRVAHNSEAPGNAAAGFSSGAPVVVFEGSKNPAAFMPHELFGRLIDMGYGHPGPQDGFRRAVQAAAVAQGLGGDFFEQLTPIVRPVQRATESLMRSQMSGDKAATAAAELVQCRARAAAQLSAYQHFGKERFLRVLYQGVAPHLSVTADVVSVPRLMYLERGCQ